MSEKERHNPKLRTVLTAVVGLLLTTVAAVMVIVLRNVEVSAEMRKEAREAVLLAEMDSAVLEIGIEVDAWVSGTIPAVVDGHPVLDQSAVQEQVAAFRVASAELMMLIKIEERALVAAMDEMFSSYVSALVDLRTAEEQGLDIQIEWFAEAQSIERSFRGALLDLQNEEIEHLAASLETARTAEGQLRFLVPGLLVLIVILATGIRRLARSAQRLEEAEALNEVRTEFIASVSHELRTPLTAVVGFSQELQEGLASFTPAEVEEFAALIARDSREVAGIVEDLLVAARAEIGDLHVTRERVDLRRQVADVLQGSNLLDGKTTEIVGNAHAIADPARITQILRNLLTNAARYGGRHVEVGIGRSGDEVHLYVADDGAGIPEHERERIFRPFERAHDNPGVAASVGLGLTVSRELARAMGGDLRYEYDGRSVLRVTLPAADTPVAA